MPRRRPGSIRSKTPVRGQRRQPAIKGLSGPAMAEIARLEHQHPKMYSGSTHKFFEIWRRFVRTPHHRLWAESDGSCGVWDCCGDPHEARNVLEAVAYRMTRHRARELRSLLRELDDLY